MVRAMERTLTSALVVIFLSACFRYVPVENPPPGAEVRASLSVEGAVRQSERLGQPVRSLSGKLVGFDNGDVQLDIITAASRGTFNDIVLRDTLAIPRDQVLVIEQREISWVRTGLVAVGVTAAAIAGIASVTSGGQDIDGGGMPPPVADRIMIPLITISR